MKFHHIGIACKDIETVTLFVEKSFHVTEKTEIIFDPLQDVSLRLMTLEDGSHIELVSGKTVERFVKKRQNLYHTCWEVSDINTSIATMTENGAMLISEPKPAVLFNNRKVAFLLTDVGIVELLESSR